MLVPCAAALAVVYVAHAFEADQTLLAKNGLEALALWLVSVTLAILACKAIISRDALVIYLAVLCLVFLVRELHKTQFTWDDTVYLFRSKKLVSVLLIGMIIWGIGWHEKIVATLNRVNRLNAMVAGVFIAYVFSQVIARRAFRHVLPNEDALHIPLEETAETAAHVAFLCLAVYCAFAVSNRKAKIVGDDQAEAAVKGDGE